MSADPLREALNNLLQLDEERFDAIALAAREEVRDALASETTDAGYWDGGGRHHPASEPSALSSSGSIDAERLAGAWHDWYEGDGVACGKWPHCPARKSWVENAAAILARLSGSVE